MRFIPWKKLKRMPLADQAALQDRLLGRFIREKVYPFSDHYRELFRKEKIHPEDIRTVEDLQKIPFSDKNSLVPDANDPKKTLAFLLRPSSLKIKKNLPFLSRVPLLLQKIISASRLHKKMIEEYQPVLLTATTGRSSAPVSFLYTTADIRRLEEAGVRIIDVFGVDPEVERGVNIFPFAPHLAFWQVAYAGFGSRMLILGTGGGKVMGTTGNLAIIDMIKPSFIVGVPGYIYHLIRTGVEKGADFSGIKKVVLGAEKVPQGLKEKIIEMLEKSGARDVRVLGTYGFTEARMAFAECPSPDPGVSHGYHLYPDMGIFEVIDPDTGQVLPTGETGELVYTPLDARGTVPIRYRTGDIAKGGIQTEPCPGCGATVPRISADLSRVSNVKDIHLSKVKGTLVNLNLLKDFFYNQKEVEEWQVEISKKDDDPFENDELNVYLAVGKGVEKETFLKRIREEVRNQTEISPNHIEIQPLKRMLERLGMETELKEKRILDRRPGK